MPSFTRLNPYPKNSSYTDYTKTQGRRLTKSEAYLLPIHKIWTSKLFVNTGEGANKAFKCNWNNLFATYYACLFCEDSQVEGSTPTPLVLDASLAVVRVIESYLQWSVWRAWLLWRFCRKEWRELRQDLNRRLEAPETERITLVSDNHGNYV